MVRFKLMLVATRVFIFSVILTGIFAAGVATGLKFYPEVRAQLGGDETHVDDHAHADDHAHGNADHDHGLAATDDHDHADEEPHVALSKQAFENLHLQLGHVTRGDYTKSVLVPARVVEIPGSSDLSVSSPVTGVVEQVDVMPGQSLIANRQMFVIRLTDESLVSCQSKLLDTLIREEVAQQEVNRLAPLIKSGALSGTKKRELQYELKQLAAQRNALVQELRARGLPSELIQNVIRQRKLATTLEVFPPSFVTDQLPQTKSDSDNQPTGYAVEELTVHPGKSVVRGQQLCSVAYHARLYIEGTAFENDLPILRQVAAQGWQVTAELPNGYESDHESSLHQSFPILRIDNHVDEATQTVRFFIELPNQVTETRHDHQHTFEQWRFRPGQRLHLRLPAEQWSDQLTLPPESVVVDGPNVVVFVQHEHDEHGHDDHDHDHEHEHEHEHDHDHDHDDHDDHDHDEHEHDVFIELEPVPVTLLHRDDRTVVIADNGQLNPDDTIALNSAYKLYLAMKMQSGGGGGHSHHDHDH